MHVFLGKNRVHIVFTLILSTVTFVKLCNHMYINQWKGSLYPILELRSIYRGLPHASGRPKFIFNLGMDHSNNDDDDDKNK